MAFGIDIPIKDMSGEERLVSGGGYRSDESYGIFLNRQRPPETQEEAPWHEIIEEANSRYGLMLDHIQISVLGMFLAVFHGENK